MQTHPPATVVQAAPAAVNQGKDSMELAKPFFQGQQLLQTDREAPGQEAPPRYVPMSTIGH